MHPISLDHTNAFKLESPAPWLVTEKSDGVRYLMILMTYDDKNLVLFVDRTLTMYMVPMGAHPDLFKGTVIDGELVVYDTETAKFKAFDALCRNGTSLISESFERRLGALQEVIRHVENIQDPLIITTKVWFRACELHQLDAPEWKSAKSDGYIFACASSRFTIGRSAETMKWKPANKTTIDFRIWPLSDRGHYALVLYDNKTRSDTIIGEAIVRPISVLRVEIDHMLRKKGVCIVECRPQLNIPEGIPWVPTSVRYDKDRSNDMVTFTNTLVTLKNAMSKEDLLAFVRRIR